MIGRTLSHYKVLEELSRGGMGIVYRALDVKLDREVALKVLPPELVADPERKRRFIQEAKAAAKLNHPHIGMVFEIDEAEGVTFIAMELIRGEQLKDIINREMLPLARSLELAMEIAEGLAGAHDKGILHRDLKPANIMVTEQGHAKIIDFGLAKLVEPLGGEGKSSDIETVSRHETVAGVIMGTASYMSPEQARGEKVDHRSDIFSFGILFYELLTGELPFKGRTQLETVGAILKDPTPQLDGIDEAPDIGALQRIVASCLPKEPDRRYPSVYDLIADLRAAQASRSAFVAESPPEVRPAVRWRAAVGIAALLLIAAVLGYAFLWREQAGNTVLRLTNPVQLTTAMGVEDDPSFSPDGAMLAYTAGKGDLSIGDFGVTQADTDIWIKLGSGPPINVTQDHFGRDRFARWSPDGRQIAFWSSREGGGYFIMPALGGPPRKIRSFVPSAALSAHALGTPAWSVDGSKLACVVYDEKLTPYVEIISVATNDSARMAVPGKSLHRYHLAWSDDERLFAYIDAAGLNDNVTQLWVLNVEDGEAHPVTDGRTNDWSPHFSADNRVLYFVSNRGGSMDLWQQPMDEDGRSTGPPKAVSAGVGMRRSVAFSRDRKKLVYSKGRLVANVWRVPILEDRPATWTDAEQLTFEQNHVQHIDLSPDGEKLLLSSDRTGNFDLWMMGTDGGDMVRLTTHSSMDEAPRWSPDGQQIAFYSSRSGNRDVWVMPVEGGPARQLTQHEARDQYPTWSPDGRQILFQSTRSGNRDVWRVPADGGEPRQLTFDSGFDGYARYSPDGNWIVFLSTRSDPFHIWRMPSEGGDPTRLTQGSGTYPEWQHDGKRIYFLDYGDRAGNIWMLSLEDGTERCVTDLVGKRRGTLGTFGLTVGREHLYLTWEEDLGDIWTMDVVYE